MTECKAYVCRHPDEDTRRRSSSGGFFSALARQVIAVGGVVFGAAFDQDFGVAHRAAETPAEAAAFMGSKYLQSDTTDCFPQVQACLEQGRQVLFTGTPCQVAGLKAFLGGEQSKLLLLECACHGVPSPLVWRKYLAQRAGSSGPLTVNFRSKASGWKNYSLELSRPDGVVYAKSFRQDPYMQAFLKNLNLRPACFRCAFKLLESEADLTMADFWGADRLCPEEDDDAGLSLVLPRTAKGQSAWEGLSSGLWWREVAVEDALRYNRAITHSVALPALRRPYWKALRKSGFDVVATSQRYTAERLWLRLYRPLNRLILSRLHPAPPQDGHDRAQSPGCDPLYEGKANCCGCASCHAVCPARAIAMEPDSAGFLYPCIDQQHCIRCGRCLGACPIRAKAAHSGRPGGD